jgi:putative membrane protein
MALGKLDDGALKLKDNLLVLTEGTGKLKDGVAPLTQGVADLNTGAAALEDRHQHAGRWAAAVVRSAETAAGRCEPQLGSRQRAA